MELNDLYDRYWKLVFGVALAILGVPEEAEDLVQDVFMALSNRAVYDAARGSVASYLILLTRSRSLDRLRSRSRAARNLERFREADLLEPRPPRTPLEGVAAQRAAERVRAELSRLPEPQRQVIELAYYGGMTQREIAADLCTPIGTVKSLSRRALEAMERSLGDLLDHG